jgi:hypothetical protein
LAENDAILRDIDRNWTKADDAEAFDRNYQSEKVSKRLDEKLERINRYLSHLDYRSVMISKTQQNNGDVLILGISVYEPIPAGIANGSCGARP